MTRYDQIKVELRQSPCKWLVTGVAGFIGSNLLEDLLKLDQHVVGLDNFSTGKPENLEEVRTLVSPKQWSRFQFIEGDITDLATCERACAGMDYVLHQAALGSVPRSIEHPIRCHHNNVTGFLTMLVAARDARVKRFVYASSSAVYGDHPGLPKVEDKTGSVLSPYAATKAMNETYAEVFAKAYGMATVGLRYFNVFGPRQDPEGPYAAVIPKWIAALLNDEPVYINGDGTTSRDFCYIANVVQANLLAATAPFPLRPDRIPSPAGAGEGGQRPGEGSWEKTNIRGADQGEVCCDSPSNSELRAPNSETLTGNPPAASIFNIAVGERTTLNELYHLLSDLCHPSSELQPSAFSVQPSPLAPRYLPFRPGDVLHSLADISKAQKQLNYAPQYRIGQGLQVAMEWYRRNVGQPVSFNRSKQS